MKIGRLIVSPGLCGLLVSFALYGCSSQAANVGDGAAVDKSALESYVAHWDGYVEAYQFPSGTDRVRIVLNEDGTGYLQVGDGDLLAPVTTTDGFPDEMVEGESWLWDKREYPLVGTRVSADRLHFVVHPTAPYGAWCALQTPNLISGTAENGEYACLHGNGISSSSGSNTCYDTIDNSAPVDCSWAYLCFTCTCTKSACTNQTDPYFDIEVDAALSDDGTKLEGTIVVDKADAGARTIRLKRT